MPMFRRQFLALGAGAALAAGQKKQDDAVIATATQDTTPRVGIVLSSFKEGEDDDGSKIAGLADPQPPGADLTAQQLDAMVRRAIDLAATRASEFHATVDPEDWVAIKTHIPTCYGLGPETRDGGAHQPYLAGTVTDPRIVRTVISYLAERKRGLRFTVIEGSPQWLPMERSKSPVDGWSTEWGGAFDGLSYHKMIAELTARFPGIRFEIADLNFADSLDLPVPGKALARNNPGGRYTIPKIIQECDKLITVAPLRTDASTGVSLSVKNYLGIAPGSKYGFPKDALMKLGSPEEVMFDLFSYRPADLAVLGGCWGVEGDDASVHHNLAIAGMKALCVDVVAATIMGFKVEELPFLALGEKQGFGTSNIDLIWTRGNEVKQAARAFKKPSPWKPAKPVA
ncbi:MAG: DUF362 domain-containing protein [Bryobacteraceae bacterium]